MRSDRSVVLNSITFFSIVCLLLATQAIGYAFAGHMEKVTAISETRQKILAWAKLDANKSVIEAGVTIPAEIVEMPPQHRGRGPAGAIVIAPFPEIVRKSTFLNHFELNWESHGHEPPIFMVPHFDFHFYNIPATAVKNVTARDTLQPEAKLIPAGYIYPGPEFSVPQMGVHAFRPADLERPFTDVLILGYYGGRMTFIEPMVTRERMLEKKDISYDIPVPESVGISTRYPTKVNIRYDGKSNAYHLIFSGFIPTAL
jgi:hypothetical protein